MNEEELTEKGLTDPYESELKKAKEEEATRIEEAKDDLTEGKIRRKREAEKKKGLLDEGSAFRTTAAIGTEIGLNSILDIFSFEPTSQVAGGALINYLAQKIRGGEISKGEMTAAGLASLIPGGAQGKALTKLAIGTGKGALSGGIEVTGQKAIDEGRLPTAGELGTGLAVGGAFGGMFQTAADSKFVEALTKRVKNPLDDALTVYAMSPPKPKISTNEKIKQALLNDEAVILPATYRGGPMEIRKEADFFDVSAALIGAGQEGKKDFLGRKIPYDRKKVTEFGGKKGAQRDLVFKHLQKKLGRKNITRAEFDEYAAEQIAAEKDLRKAIKLLNLRSYAANKNIDLSDYPTVESQLNFLNEINKAKRNKTGYTDYRETFDYGHILSAKTGFRLEDLGLNRISNTEIEAARNIVSRDPYTNRIIEILQQGNRERGSRRDFTPVVQRMRNTAGTVVEDFVKWRANKPGSKEVNLTKILDKFIPRDQHDNYLQFIQKKFYERRKLSGSLKQFMENELGIPYNDFLKFNNKMKLRVRRLYEKDVEEAGNIIGRQQYDQADKFMRDAIDEFIGLHHFSKPKKLRTTKEEGDLYDMAEDLLPRDIETLLDMILPDGE